MKKRLAFCMLPKTTVYVSRCSKAQSKTFQSVRRQNFSLITHLDEWSCNPFLVSHTHGAVLSLCATLLHSIVSRVVSSSHLFWGGALRDETKTDVWHARLAYWPTSDSGVCPILLVKSSISYPWNPGVIYKITLPYLKVSSSWFRWLICRT